MESELDFDKLIEYTVKCLIINQAHPEIPRNLRWYLRFLIMNIVYWSYLYFLIYGMMAFEDVKSNIIDICTIASYIVVCFVINFHLFVVLKYRSTFSIIISDVRKDYNASKKLPDDEKEIVLKFALEGRRVTIYWAMVLVGGFANFTILPLVRMFYYYVTGSFRYLPVIDVISPDFVTGVHEGVGLSIWYVYWVYFVLYTCVSYTGVVPLGPVFLLHACGKLELLRSRMMKLFPADESVTYEERTEKLRIIAMELQAVYDFVDKLKTSLKLLYELTLNGTTLITPIIGYVMIESIAQSQIRPEIANIFFGAIIICSLPCYYGDRLIEKSSELKEAVYASGWESVYDKKTRSTLLILLTRMQQTVAIRSIFVTVNLPALADVFKSAYALFNFLLTVSGQKT